MSNTANISNKSEFTQELFNVFFKYQILEESQCFQLYYKQVGSTYDNYKDPNFYKEILDFAVNIRNNRPIAILFFDRSIPVEVPNHIYFIEPEDLSSRNQLDYLRNCILIVCDEVKYNRQLRWDIRHQRVLTDMNPELTFIIN